MGCLKNYVMREPLVDTVDKRQVCTDHFPLKVSEKKLFFILFKLFYFNQTFDLKTMTVNDIEIDSNFQLHAVRDDYIHAFVTYFIAEFTACSQKTFINTGEMII